MYMCICLLFLDSLKLTREINDYNFLKGGVLGDVATMNDQENYDTIMVSKEFILSHMMI